MASATTFPNPYLVAVLFVCNTRIGSGAQILFHYPSAPLTEESNRANADTLATEDEDESSSDLDESSTDDDGFYAPTSLEAQSSIQSHSSKVRLGEHHQDQSSANTHSHPQQSTAKKQNSTSLFGFSEDGLVSLLAPDRAWHKRKFELGIDNLTFVGRPVFVRTDGVWRKNKKRKQQALDIVSNASDTATDQENISETEGTTRTYKTKKQEPPSGETKSQLTMFHAVFVMNPPPLEHSMRVKDMYDHVIKKFSRALKWEQSHNDYVWKETEKISALKAAGISRRSSPTNIARDILNQSSLAVAISNVYNAISISRIASVTLSSDISFSLQIPPVTSTAYLPSLTEPPIQPGLWLTTATDTGPAGSGFEGSDPDHATHVAKQYTLLLKSPPHRIAKDAIDAGGPLAAHLPSFVSSLRPTKSFHKLSASSQMSWSNIQALASHLIYWRRAVAIPPLHQQHIYIVSPNADMRKLAEATKHYEQQFAPTMPNMPSLPRILHELSSTPKPFSTLIPSTDHKEIYYLALAWLMRNGWVTQLRTFAYVRIDPDVKRAVQESERDSRSTGAGHSDPAKDDIDSKEDHFRPRERPSVISRLSSEGNRSHDEHKYTLNGRMASLILNPMRATTKESKWLSYIQTSLATGKGFPLNLSAEDKTQLQRYWPLFVKYFNGQIALETIPVREGVKRKFFWNLLGKAGLDVNRGTEDQALGHKAIIVAVRHW